MNIISNFGYIGADLMWLLVSFDNQPDWWYRSGYVTGDLMISFFLREDETHKLVN